MIKNINLDQFLPTMGTPEKVYQLFDSLGYKVLDSRLKTNPSVYNLPVKEAALVEKIYAVSNYDRRFQILLFKLKEENKEAIRTIPEKILREVDFPFIIFTPDFKTYTFTLVEKVREGPGEFKRKLTKLIVDSSQPYHTDKEILRSLTLSSETKNPVEVYKLFQSAFSVEKVTKKFFTEYREVFERLIKEVIKQNKHLKSTLFSRDGSVENFVKILLGRLMFLYFIQKRGWLNCFDGWGSGDKKFLYNKFQEAKKDKRNYFKDYLEALFFDTLNNPRRDKPDQATQFGGRIPFLNGGLFEPNYSYKDPSQIVLIDNDSFEQVFSVFEKYNFTVKEDEPLEKEVAIDPEMLGKVFENLLEENLRKGKGTYYTPREIVHYMCHESLINYLASEVGIEQEEIRSFLDREQSLEKKETLSPLIKSKAKEIDEKLADIKVLDPACGSGAFLIGMLHEVINARLSLNRELGRSLSEYELKKATIQNNIHGVDIDPGATEIAKLRLWLTLVVDHNLSEIEPLPNLDYKIMIGNSLLDEFMGVKLFNFKKARQRTNGKKILKLFEDDIQQVSMFEDDNKANILKALQKLHSLYFKESDPERKKQIRTQIDKIEFDLIETTVKDEVKKLEDEINHIASNPMLKGLGIPKEIADKITKISSKQAQILETFNEIKKSNVKPFFLFQLHFSDVFERKGGFDVVIANPPYINTKRGIRETEKVLLKKNYSTATGQFDLFTIFIERSLQLSSNLVSFIVPKPFLNNENYEVARNLLLSNSIIDLLVGSNVFEAGVESAVFIASKKKSVGTSVFKIDNSPYHTIKLAQVISQDFFNELPFHILNTELTEGDIKIFSKINNSTRVHLGDIIQITRGIECGKNDESITREKNQYQLLRGEDVGRYKIDYKNLYINFDIKDEQNFKPLSIYKNPKLILRRVANFPEATLDEENFIVLNTLYCLYGVSDEAYDYRSVLALINSRLLSYWFSKIFISTDKLFPYIRKSQLEKLPLPELNTNTKNNLNELVQSILVAKRSNKNLNTSEYEQQIDQLVYKLYGLTPEEIAVVEGGEK